MSNLLNVERSVTECAIPLMPHVRGAKQIASISSAPAVPRQCLSSASGGASGACTGAEKPRAARQAWVRLSPKRPDVRIHLVRLSRQAAQRLIHEGSDRREAPCSGASQSTSGPMGVKSSSMSRECTLSNTSVPSVPPYLTTASAPPGWSSIKSAKQGPFTLLPVVAQRASASRERVRDAFACVRRHQAFAVPRERDAPGV